MVSLQADATTSDSADSESSQRESVDLSYRRLWPNRWLSGGVLSLNRNDELGLDLRTSVDAGGGRILKQSMPAALEGFDIAGKSVTDFLCLISGTMIDYFAST
jgi:hypothetical protein